MLRFYIKFVVQRCIVCCNRRHLDKSTSDYIRNTGTRGGRIFVTLVTSTPQQMYVILLIYQYCSVRSVSFSMFVFRLMRKVIHSTWSWLMLDILHSYGNLVPHYKAMFKVTIIHYVLTSLVPNRINHPKSYSFVNGLIWIWNTSSRNFLLVWLTAQPQVMWLLWWMCIIKLWNLVWMIYCQFGLKP